MFDVVKRPLLIQVEMVDKKRKFKATSAFKALMSVRAKMKGLLARVK